MDEIKEIVLIGSGNVATHFARVFNEKGIRVIQVYSLNIHNAEVLAARYGAQFTDDINAINHDADLYIIAVKDDAISTLNKTLRLPGKIVVHTSGTSGLDALKDISETTGVFYPLQTFTKTRPVDWQKIPLCIEGSDAETTSTLVQSARKISGQVFEINSELRKKLHLAAVFTNNFTNYLLSLSKEIVEDRLPFYILHALAAETIEKAFEIGPDKAQTGPAVRGDQKTMDAHLQLLENNPSAKELYLILTKLIGEKFGKE